MCSEDPPPILSSSFDLIALMKVDFSFPLVGRKIPFVVLMSTFPARPAARQGCFLQGARIDREGKDMGASVREG